MEVIVEDIYLDFIGFSDLECFSGVVIVSLLDFNKSERKYFSGDCKQHIILENQSGESVPL